MRQEYLRALERQIEKAEALVDRQRGRVRRSGGRDGIEHNLLAAFEALLETHRRAYRMFGGNLPAAYDPAALVQAAEKRPNANALDWYVRDMAEQLAILAAAKGEEELAGHLEAAAHCRPRVVH